MIQLKQYRIKNVDEFSFLGRDYHPDKSDEGLTVTIVRMEVEFHDRDFVEPVVDWDGRIYVDAMAALKDNRTDERFVTHFTGVTRDGRVLELVGHELEEVS